MFFGKFNFNFYFEFGYLVGLGHTFDLNWVILLDFAAICIYLNSVKLNIPSENRIRVRVQD